MMPGMPGGRQLAAWLSSGALASRACRFAAYAAVSCGPAGGPPALPPRPPPAPRPPAGPKPTSHTPVKSGSFASADQSAAVGGVGFACCAIAGTPATPVASSTTTAVERILRELGIFDPLYTV